MASILIVDDDPIICDYLCAILSRHRHLAYSAVDTAQALALFDSERPELVISDFIMPNADGFALIRQLRAKPGGTEVHVILHTAAIVNPAMYALAKACGVEIILEKPYTSVRFLAAVEEALGSTPQAVEVPAELDRDHFRVLADQLAGKVRELEEELSRRRQVEETVQTVQGRLLRAEELLTAVQNGGGGRSKMAAPGD